MKLDGSSHVCHIIAASNGGPDHADNFIALSADFNVTIGNAHDDIMAYLAGVDRTCAAIKACLQTECFDSHHCRVRSSQGKRCLWSQGVHAGLDEGDTIEERARTAAETLCARGKNLFGKFMRVKKELAA